MVLLTDYISQALNCNNIKSLRDRLNHPIDRSKILKLLQGKKVRTTYNDRNGLQKTFFVGGLSHQSAAVLPAYGSLKQPWNINVAAHYYCRHKIKLKFPYIHCITQKTKIGSEEKFYPLELVELVEEPPNKWLENMYSEIGNSTETCNSTLFTINEDEAMDFRRNACTETDENEEDNDW